MIFIDGEPFPPSLHGTGTEDYFNTAWCPTQELPAPYHGITLPGGPNWSGRTRCTASTSRTRSRSSVDPRDHRARSRQQAQRRLSSVAYWYQAEPHQPLTLPAAGERMPRPH